MPLAAGSGNGPPMPSGEKSRAAAGAGPVRGRPEPRPGQPPVATSRPAAPAEVRSWRRLMPVIRSPSSLLRVDGRADRLGPEGEQARPVGVDDAPHPLRLGTRERLDPGEVLHPPAVVV